MNAFRKIASSFLIATFIFTSTGFFDLQSVNRAHAQQPQGIVDYVVDGQQVLDGCQGVTGAKYASIAAELGIDVGGGVRGGLSAIGDELSSGGGSLLDGLQDIGGALAGTGIGEAVGSLGSSIGDALNIGGITSTIGTVLGGPVGNILGGVVGGLFGGGGPDPVVEEGLRGLQQQASKLSAYASQTVSEKERCLDALSQKAGQRELRSLTAQSVKWVQSEFENFGEKGQSAFVQDLNQYLNNVAQDEFDTYISDASDNTGPFSRVCNFLRQPVGESVTNDFLNNSGTAGQDGFEGTELGQVAIDENGAGCQLAEGVSEEEAQNFLEGDFSAGGGWEGLARSAGNPNMSPVTAYLQQRSQLDQRINEAEEREQEQLQWGQGFIADRSNDGFTPGSVVQGITERLSTSDISRLELIDEMGEVAGNIGNTLIGKITGQGGSSGGLATAEGSDTVGGSEATAFEYLADSLGDRIEEQLGVERNIRGVLNQVVPLYDNSDVDELLSGVQSCLAEGNLGPRADELYASASGNLDSFRSTVLQTQTKVDWRGEPFSWVGVIEETGERPIGWTGTDYNWSDDDVDRYANQGFSDECELESGDGGNATYVITQEWIPNPERDFNGAFAGLEPDESPFDEAWGSENVDDDLDLQTVGGLLDWTGQIEKTILPVSSSLWNSGAFRDAREDYAGASLANDGGIYTVWQKQICAINGDDNHWQEQSPIVDHEKRDHFADTPAGNRRRQNAQCDLIEDNEYCISPAYRTPQFISGEMYRENSDGEVEASECQSASDAGTHYFVQDQDQTWSTRECRLRQSPQGSAVEWEPGFPESAGSTNAQAYQDGVTDTPVADQNELIIALEDMAANLEDSESEDSVLEIQEDFYNMREQFNDTDAAAAINREARRFIRNIRNLNEIALDSQEENQDEEGFQGCSGVEELNTFGSDFLDDNPEEDEGEGQGDEGEVSAPAINRFSTSGFSSMIISWSADADSCEASTDATIDWDGEVPTSGTRNVRDIPESGVTTILTCERDGETVSRNSFFQPSSGDNDGGRGFVPEEDVR